MSKHYPRVAGSVPVATLTPSWTLLALIMPKFVVAPVVDATVGHGVTHQVAFAMMTAFTVLCGLTLSILGSDSREVAERGVAAMRQDNAVD